MHAYKHTHTHTHTHTQTHTHTHTHANTHTHIHIHMHTHTHTHIHTYIGMVVANSDRETFGMSYTDDGEPFESICIPCVMISSDVCSKLEACKVFSPLYFACVIAFVRPWA